MNESEKTIKDVISVINHMAKSQEALDGDIDILKNKDHPDYPSLILHYKYRAQSNIELLDACLASLNRIEHEGKSALVFCINMLKTANEHMLK